MKKLPYIFFAVLAASCQTSSPSTTAPAAATPQGHLAAKQDVPQRLAQLPRTVIDYDRSLLNDEEKRVVEKLIEASKFIDEIYWLQVSEQNPEYRRRLAAQADDSPLERDAYEYFLANRGRWDRLAKDEPFIEPFGEEGRKPEGAAFYPPDMTKDELERYIAAHPEQKDALQGLFTVVRREGDRLVAIPYSQYLPAASPVRCLPTARGRGNHLERHAPRLPDQARLRVWQG